MKNIYNDNEIEVRDGFEEWLENNNKKLIKPLEPNSIKHYVGAIKTISNLIESEKSLLEMNFCELITYVIPILNNKKFHNKNGKGDSMYLYAFKYYLYYRFDKYKRSLKH